MIPCASCGSHHRRVDSACPHCGARISAPSAGRPSAAAALLALGLTACPSMDIGDEPQALYGVVVADEDGDGYDAERDCDDTNSDIHPEADETPGDGVDSNCDGADDT